MGDGPMFRPHCRRFLLPPLVCGLLATPLASWCQSTSASLTGEVVDRTGAGLPGVLIEVVATDSGRSWAVTTTETGGYTFAALPAGVYRLRAARDGFRSFAVERVTLDVAQRAHLDLSLDVAGVSETMEVVAENLRIGPGSSPVATTIGQEEAVRLPANGRNYLSLLLLAPGALTPVPSSFTDGSRTGGGGRPYINGNRKEANNYLLDGVDANQTTDNLVAYQPSLEAVEELTLIGNNAPAEFGSVQGGVVSITLRSGTSRFQGSAFGFLRDDALNAANRARGWQGRDPLNPAAKTPMTHHAFGGTFGGPIGGDRVFFFGDYQGIRRRTGPSNGVGSFVPEAMRRGDFSALLQGPNPQQLYDPLTARPDPSDPSRVIRSPFPGNQIPLDRIDPVARALFASPYYPTPAVPGTIDNTFYQSWGVLETDQADVKANARLTPRDDVVVRYSHGEQSTESRFSLPILSGDRTDSPFRSVAMQWMRRIGSTLVNEARVGYTRSVAEVRQSVDTDVVGNLGESLGIPGVNEEWPGLPALLIAGSSGVGGAQVVQDFTVNTFQYQDTLTWSRGQHLVKSGVLALRFQQNVYFSGNTGQMGLFEFTGQYTRDLDDPRSTGSGIADFFLGYPRRLARGDYAGTWGHRSTQWAGFVQDDWRVSNKLTLNLGLRYEYRTPLVEVHDRQVNFDLETGAPQLPGEDGNSRALYDGFAGDWQPRLGAVWRPGTWGGRVVVRGAYGISSFMEGTGTNLRLPLNPPFFNEFETIYSNPAVVGSRVSEGFVALREKDPLQGTVLRAWDRNVRPARSQQWNVTAEVLAGGGIALSAAYVGQRGSHLILPINFNQRLSPNGPRPFDDVYPQIGGVILTASEGRQRYDALQATARKRFGAGWALSAAYTLAKAMTDSRGFFSDSGQAAMQAAFWANPRDQRAEWGLAPFDVRHALNVAAIYDLPWGRDRRMLTDATAWLDALVGGWSVAGLWRTHGGFALTVFAPDQSQTGARTGRPDRVGSGQDPHQVGPGQLWFDTSVFVLPQRGTFGNAGVGIVRGPGMNVVDLSVSKRFTVRGPVRVELRAEAFNLFNTPVFAAPERNLTSPTFGQVRGSMLEREIQLEVRVVF